MKLLKRIVGLFSRPDDEWAAIAAEDTDPGAIYSGHILWLALIPAASVLVGLALSGGRYLGSAAITTAVTAAAVGYVIAISLPMIAAAAIAYLAPHFKSDAGINEALKLVAYSMTPFWLAGFFYLSVSLSRFVVAGLLYSLYLLFTGAAPVMSVPLAQRVPFTLVATITILIVNMALSWVVNLLKLPYYGF